MTVGNDKKVEFLYPQKRKYIRSDDPMTEAAVKYGFLGDFYLSLGEPTDSKRISSTSWTIRASYKPLMIWVWIGCLIMSVGGFVAIFSRKQSLKWPLTTTATSKNKKPINEKGQESARPI